MSDPSTAKRSERLKLAAIPLLALVFIGVVGFGGGSDESPSADGSTKAVPAQTAGGVQPRARRPRDWPELDLEEALVHDPFTRDQDGPNRDARPDVEDPQPVSVVIERRELPVDVFYQTERKAVALAGGLVVSVGDVLDDGWLVEVVTPERVVLAPPLY